MRPYFGIFIILNFLVGSSYAQSLEEKDFKLYSIESGLSGKHVNDITQDAYGYLWIATKKGLNRFDGNSFQHFYADSSNNSLPEDNVVKLKWINKVQLAATTTTGLHIINTKNLERRNLIIPPGELKHIYKVNNIMDLTTDENGNVLLLTRSGFYKFNSLDKLTFRYDAYKKEQLATVPFVFGNSMARTAKGEFLLSTISGIWLYKSTQNLLELAEKTKSEFYQQVAAEGQTRLLQAEDLSLLLFTGISKELIFYNTILKKRFSIPLPFPSYNLFDWRSKFFKLNDTLYAITGKEKGFYLINYKAATGTYIFNPSVYFKDFFCSSLLTDYNGTLWIGTGNGLFRQNKLSSIIEKKTIPLTFNAGNKDLKIVALRIAGNKIFAGTFGNGLLVFDRQTMEPLKQIDLSSYWSSSNLIYNLLTVNKEILYAGTAGPLIWINTKNYSTGKVFLPGWDINHNWVSSLFKDSRNNIYVTNSDVKGFYYRAANKDEFQFNIHPEKYFNILCPYNINEDESGNIWFAGSGLSRYNYQKEQFDLLLDSFPKIKLSRKEVNAVQFDKDGNIYLGVAENGLLIYNLSQKKFRLLTRSDGLPDNTITALRLVDKKLWIGTEIGIANYDLTTKIISSFGINDGMPADLFTAFSFYYDTTDQHLYCAYNNTIVRFDPKKLIKNNSPPQFSIEHVLINGKESFYHPDEPISLSYMQNNLVINLGAVNFTDPYLQRFAYRFVKNGNEPWNETGMQRNIIFSNLAPSDYRLQVKIFNKNNSWPEQIREISIQINPPFWKKLWFLLAILLLTTAIFIFLYRRRIQKVKQNANLDKLVAQTEMKALHAQMNPHFIFNSLNSIREMILNNENRQASHYLSKFAQLIRITLNQSSHSFISLRNTIDYLNRYLEMEETRNIDFTHSLHIDEGLDIDDTFLPPMLIQPFIENAIWHGVSPENKSIHVDIRFILDQQTQQLLCIIEDNGIGIHASMRNKNELQNDHLSIGIENIRQRIRLLNEKYNLQYTLTIKDKSTSGHASTGTIVTIYLPGKNNIT